MRNASGDKKDKNRERNPLDLAAWRPLVTLLKLVEME
jgi:hypothetical protein